MTPHMRSQWQVLCHRISTCYENRWHVICDRIGMSMARQRQRHNYLRMHAFGMLRTERTKATTSYPPSNVSTALNPRPRAGNNAVRP